MSLKQNPDLILFNFTGSSMYPTLKPGDQLLVKPNVKIENGCIAVFNVGNRSVTHRLIETKYEKYVFRGDRQLNFEEVSKSQITGKVLFIIRNGKTFDPPQKSKIAFFYRFAGDLYLKVARYLYKRRNGLSTQSKAAK